MTNPRAGRFVKQLEGYVAFEPAPLPPDPPLALTPELQLALSAADQAVGRLDGLTILLPDVDLFLAMFVRREALLSSQIEGTDCTLDDIITYELDETNAVRSLDVREVVNYVAAMERGISELDHLPLCNRLLRDVHATLLRDGRGADKEPGEFRRSQNWIGPPGCTITTASYVPPPPNAMQDAMAQLERFLHDGELPTLIAAGLAHAQFETVHPFLDGNGRVGRLLVTLVMYQRQVLSRPVLYLSTFLRRHRTRYFEYLTAIRNDGAWEAWIKFFLDGIATSAREAADVAQRVHELRERDRARVMTASGAKNELRLLDELYRQPVVNAAWVERHLGVAAATANKILDRCEAAGVIRETTGKRRGRLYRYDEYVDLFDAPVAPMEQEETHAGPGGGLPRRPE